MTAAIEEHPRLDPFEQGDTFDPTSVQWAMHLTDLRHVVEAIHNSAEVVIDLETTGDNEHATGRDPSWPESARVSLASLTLPTKADPDNPTPPTWAVPLSHPDSPLRGHWREALRVICQAILDADVPVSNQNLKFDCKWVYAATGVDLSPLFAWCTQIGAHLLDETTSTSLKERAPATFGVRRWDDFDLSTPAASEKVPMFDLGLYAARDTYWTWRSAVYQRTLMGVGREGEGLDEPEDSDEVEQRRLGQLAVWCAMPTAKTLTAVEQRGFTLDLDWTRSALADVTAEAEADKEWLIDRVPVTSDRDPSFAPTALWFETWAEAAVQRGDLRVASLTGTGKPQWNKAVLVRQWREGSEVAERLLAYRKMSKRAEFLTSWLNVVTPEGLVHTTYHAGRVVTGRLSSSDPNMQQITAALKPAYVAREGYVIADLDYSQIEMRAAAYVARCIPMIEAFKAGKDLHRILAATVTGLGEDEVDADQRQGGKAGNFGFLFGMEAQGFQTYAESVYDVSFTAEQAVDVREAFFDQWDGMAQWHERQARRARQTGQVVSPIGRVRRLPAIFDGNPSVSSHAERQAINSPVQGFASDLMQTAAASIEGNLPGYEPVPDVAIVATVHDSIVVEVPANDWKRATGRCMRRMLDLHPVLSRLGCDFDVPLAVEAKVGTRWGLADVGTIR